ncbi:hypothetical protein [Streptomyces zaehneri]|uniref:hypothetical protein n=1 Tax=Streptomyces zaehneri TaxID=3051180 RepID=UPI0028D8B9E6|nr:hypothetical protein [Streptomyces sp. DSM 40713]
MRPAAACPPSPVRRRVRGRNGASRGRPAELAFGDGAHRCPGAAVAVLEADVLLSRLFAPDGLRMTGRPRVSFEDEAGGYRTREPTVTVPGSAK